MLDIYGTCLDIFAKNRGKEDEQGEKGCVHLNGSNDGCCI